MGQTAFLFPGQGAQVVGMGRDFHAAFPVARQTFAQAGEALGWDVAQKCFDGPQEELNRTAVSQPAILTVSAAVFRVMQEQAPALTGACAAAAGLSLGEYTALVAAGALDFADAARLVQKRGEYMEAACRERPGAMVSILGLDGEAVRTACAEAGGEVWAANFNAPGQVVISGSEEAVQRAAEACQKRGARRIRPLAVSGAFHTPFMARAAERLKPELTRARFRVAGFPVVANATAAEVTQPEEFRAQLAAQVTSPVLWEQSIQKLVTDGFDRFVEVGPGNVLSGLLRRIAPNVEAINVADVAAMDKLKRNC